MHTTALEAAAMALLLSGVASPSGVATSATFPDVNWREALAAVPGLRVCANAPDDIGVYVKESDDRSPGCDSDFAEFPQMTEGVILGVHVAVLPLGCGCNSGPIGLLIFALRDGKADFMRQVEGSDMNGGVADGAVYTMSFYMRAGEGHAGETGVAITRYSLGGWRLRQSQTLNTTIHSQVFTELQSAMRHENRWVFPKEERWTRWF